MLNELAKIKNALRKMGKVIQLADFQRACEDCGSFKVQELTVITADKSGAFSFECFRCVPCHTMWPKVGYEVAFSRYCEDDV
jgi:hypothetical protein